MKRKKGDHGGEPSSDASHLSEIRAEHVDAHALDKDPGNMQRDFAISKYGKGTYKSGLMEHCEPVRELVAHNSLEHLSQEAIALATSRSLGSCLSTLSSLYIVENGTDGLVESCFVLMKIMLNWQYSAHIFHANTGAIFSRSHTKQVVVLEGMDNIGKSLIIRSVSPLAKFCDEVDEKVQPGAMQQDLTDHRMLLVDEPCAMYLHALEDAALEEIPLFITTKSRATWKEGPLEKTGYFVNAKNGRDLDKFNGNMHPGVWYILNLVCKAYRGCYCWKAFTPLMIGVAMDVTKKYQDYAWDAYFTITPGCETEFNDVYLAYRRKYNCHIA